jgi:aldehyde:ferredoxin oxidoreductase
LHEPLPTGVTKGIGLTAPDLDKMIRGYYQARGWTEDGLIPDEKLRELDLLDIVREPVAVV